MKNYFIGIDNGGTRCKAVIFDEEGKEISSANRKLVMITPKMGFTERNMNDLWDINQLVIKEALDRAKIDPECIKGVACTGHGKGLYLVGYDNEPCYPGIISTDSRAWTYPELWKENGVQKKVF